MHRHPRLAISARERAQPSWVRLALLATFAQVTNTASDRRREHIIDRIDQLAPDNEARTRAAEYYL